MTRAARSALRSGNPGEALRLIQQIQGKFGAGLLGQEREALTIEALGRSGQREQARTRAEAFLRAFPSSPHAQDVRMFAP
jgi:outer membrane protein assembly factor BamD (BamD/ComL family)